MAKFFFKKLSTNFRFGKLFDLTEKNKILKIKKIKNIFENFA